MRRHIKRIIILLLVIIILSSLVWRLWPHSFADVISIDENKIVSLACTASISGLKDDGTTFIDNYKLQALTTDREEFSAIINILSQSNYRQSFQNLLPWAITSVSSDGGAKNANIFLVWGNTENETCFLTIHSDGKAVVSSGRNNELSVYYITESTTLDKLVNYLQENGG